MKKTMWIVSFMALIGTAIMLLFMPDRVPMHYDLAWNVDRWGSKYENLIFPIIIVCVSLFWTLLVRFSEKKTANSENEKEQANAKLSAKLFCIAGMTTAIWFTMMQAFILYKSYRLSTGN